MSDLFKHPEHLELNHCMAWNNLIRVDQLGVDAYDIAIGEKHYLIRAGNAAAIRAQQHDLTTRRKEPSSARAPTMPSPISYIDKKNGSCKAL